ncbi:MAG: tetratricopeptide repeat protein [Lachnospiraceae bacterium]|nr:tetratricopeptide repeat protein [Lachnospiraceae bacterium]MCI9658523.1 tetratricopeptide repeat protein [Lachnospiraceae bacterium]
MKCFNCGAELTALDYCGKCGADVSRYCRLFQTSNAYYNEGLEKARVRDLSGAVISLRQSLKINKKNTDARNLLGLVQFEMGEVVEALSQWVLSRNFQKEDNLASYYIEEIQKNPARLSAINTTIKKYNQSLFYCEQGSYDLAVIQLKKILSTNRNLIKGHQLLALLYMKMDDYGRARSELDMVIEIDNSNTRALRYLKELDDAEGKQPRRKAPNPKEEVQVGKDSIAYVSGNETIIQPIGVKDNTGLHSVINVAIGLAIGVAVMWFLIMPAQQQLKSAELNEAVAEYSDQLESKTAALSSLQSEMDTLKAESEAAVKAAGEAADKLASQEELLKAYRLFTETDMAGALEQLEQIDKETLTDDGKVIYDSLFAQVGEEAIKDLYKAGYDAYRAREYETAVENLQRCYDLNNENQDALYFLARSYHGAGDTEHAKQYYQKIVDEFPGTKIATDAARFMAGI